MACRQAARLSRPHRVAQPPPAVFRYRGIAAGRNIGYGAVPVAASSYPLAPLAGLPDPPSLASQIQLDVVDGADTHGFVLLDLGGGAIEASYWALTRPSGPIHRETIGAATI